MAEDYGAEHDFLGQLLRFRFDHQHGGGGAGDDEVELAGLELLFRRVEDVLAIGIADAGGTDRAGEGNARQRQCGRGADHRRDVGIDLGVDRQHVNDDLDFVVEAIREQRADRAIDQAAGQRFLFGRTAFALEETTGDTAGSVGLFLVIDGQRKEILARLGILGSHNGNQNHGFFHGNEDGTASLAGNFTGFDGDLMGTIGECFFHDVKHIFLSLSTQ
ncbi:MAG: hypothetical protein FD131_655 [Rhodocyclaceae bacterium]|nr:MAG: hypothetical protein FD131_655 [Rhodocyclaceae bacterium]